MQKGLIRILAFCGAPHMMNAEGSILKLYIDENSVEWILRGKTTKDWTRNISVIRISGIGCDSIFRAKKEKQGQKAGSNSLNK
jgi:hypothetical protein